MSRTAAQLGPAMGSSTATPSMAAADQAVRGTVNFMTASHATMGVNQSEHNVGINTLVRIPINVGVTAQFTGTFLVIGITHTIRVDFYGWTPHTVTLVSPTRIHLSGPFAQRDSVGVTTLKLTFVPEPGTLLLLGAGVLALGLASRRSGGAR